jgi:hypothetical protein
MERVRLTVTMVIVAMLTTTQAAWMVNFALVGKNG